MSKFLCPVNNSILTSKFGMRKNPVTGVYKLHAGIDLISTDGVNVPIYSTADGTVRLVKSTSGGYGNHVVITHSIDGVKFESLYAHLKTISVRTNEKVKQGELIGLMGTTGSSTGVHLHFEIHKPTYVYDGGKYPNAVDPLNYISITEKPEEGEDIDLTKITIMEMQKNLRDQAVAMVQQGYANKKFNDKDWVRQAEDGSLTIANLIGLKILVDSK